MSTRTTMLATILRGLRSRALLSAGSVLLTALAIGSAVLGPVFQVAVTNSYLVTRLAETPNRLTGLSWDFQPTNSGSGPASAAAARAVGGITGPFAAPQTALLSDEVSAYGGRWRLAARQGACAHLEVEGACPRHPGEVLMLAGDRDLTGTSLGSRIDLAGLGRVRVVGTYRVPPGDQEDFWFDLERFASIPPHQTKSLSTPYRPAPLFTVPRAFDDLAPGSWHVKVDRRLTVPPDLTLADLDRVERVAAALDRPPKQVRGGRLAGNAINDIAAIVAETRAQQTTARNSIAPAVISLVLVALALLLRLLMAAADLRLPELALASLRGLSRRRMWQLGLSEPLALLLIALPVGGLLGIGLSSGLVRWWLVPGLPLPLPATALVAGLGVALAAVVVAVLAVGLVLRVTLSDQLTGVRRPRRSSRLTVVGQLALAAIAVAVLVSKLSTGEPGEPDVTDLVLPVLLAVVAGIAATRLTAVTAAWWTRRRRPTRSLAGFVAARAISRRQEGTLVILPVTAAIAICVFGAGVYGSAAQWRASVAATAAPAPVVWTSPLTLEGTVGLTHRLDPDGRYLMAATTLVTQGPVLSVVDAPRLTRVATWPDQWTPGLSAAQVADRIGLQVPLPTLIGTHVGLTADNGVQSDDDLYVRLRLQTTDEGSHYSFLGPLGPGRTRVSAATPFCSAGCELQAITVGGPATSPQAMTGALQLSDFVADGAPIAGAVAGAGWGRSPEATSDATVADVRVDGETLVVSLNSLGKPVIAQLAAGAIPAALPVLKGVDATTSARAGSSSVTSATTFDVAPVATAASVPLLGPIGVLIDYGMLTTDRTIYPQKSPVYVLARADTPQAMQDGLRGQGASVSTTLAQVQRTLDQSAYALALRLYAVVAVLVLLMALAGLFVSTAVQLPARRRDAAALRVVGVPRRTVMSAVLRELALVLGGTALAGLAAGTLAQYVVLRTVRLGYVESLTTPALVATIGWARLVVLAGLAVLLFGTVALVSAGLTVRGARGATLRESAR